MDYYKLLQIDAHADQEIIEVAYKRLAKKYHPDVCDLKDSLSTMSRINEAYSVLKNTESRILYDKTREKHEFGFMKRVNVSHKDLSLANHCLRRYLEAIKEKDYTLAYSFLHPSHKKTMSLSMFKNWQNGVAKVYRPLEFDVKCIEVRKKTCLDNFLLDHVLIFKVDVIEYNQIMEQTEKDHFSKQVIIYNDQASIHLNHEEVVEAIKRFDKLAKLKSRKWHTEKKGLVFRTRSNYALFLSYIELEIERYMRYEMPFSLVFINLKRNGSSSGTEIVNKIQKIINQNIRKLDKCILIDKSTFLVLLPGTRLLQGTLFADKICEIIMNNPDLDNYHFIVRRTVIENDVNQVDELKKIIQNERNSFSHQKIDVKKHT